jgi:hypothetical protein
MIKIIIYLFSRHEIDNFFKFKVLIFDLMIDIGINELEKFFWHK